MGHDNDSRGAKAYDGTSEFIFNDKVAKLVMAEFEDDLEFQVDVFKKDGLDYSQIDDIYKQRGGMDLSMELHFNSYYKPAFGQEMLVLKDDIGSQKVAKKFCKKMNSLNGITLRHDEGVFPIGTHSRGGVCLRNIHHADYVMLYEPAFCNTSNLDSVKIIGNPEWYAKHIAASLRSIFESEGLKSEITLEYEEMKKDLALYKTQNFELKAETDKMRRAFEAMIEIAEDFA